MLLSILDLGSNTIRAVLYQDGIPIQNESVFVGTVRYVENGVLSPCGVDAILNAFSTLSPFLSKCDRVIAFATASLRGLTNNTEVLDTIYEKTGFRVRLLSAAEEARYDYLGLCRTHHPEEGIGGDLGGGSMQLYTFSKSGLMAYCSLPLGSMRLRCDYVKNDFPTEAEGDAIYHYVYEMLSNEPHFKALPYENLYLTGGSIRAIVKNWGQENWVDKSTIHSLLSFLTPSLLLRVCGKRAETIMPALYTCKALLAYTNATRIYAVESGVREGILEELAITDSI